ncbi:PD-(D/E)XK nuclease-like domain-containing protein [Marinitenerispora sediminis]|uniref:Putative exodeoxyribonuclease 8 PDDEXK-like domain-containing protein n=1 Tax=Marinitenerispora sediminis TaxID=1931232 RepID=A0A368T6M2_9ACTN|nr:PD-(D/E)XK nuclease-like domain-containing protein [Marinitenerispora sediminis]RCV51184.1 hypothetical protein DEF23_20895 [Marinitenerispora sediminis]RCV59347.1 hypothetical protein DEF24_10210 [Marinitenerispora sediminis]
MTVTSTTSPAVITEPGVYDLPEDVYHADPVPGGSLSSTGARRLLPPSCPALFKYEREHPKPKRAFDLGRAAHKEVLGEGGHVAVVDAPDYKTKGAREQRDAIYAAGGTPLLPHEYEQVQAMAAALRAHPLAGRLFQPGNGRAEQSLFWQDSYSGVACRARLDWLVDPVEGRRRVVVDYKTCASAAPDKLSRAVYEFGYHQQAAWYLDGLVALGVDDAPAFAFVCQEKQPPYLVTVMQPDHVAMQIGRHLNQQARTVYARCVETGYWPGYSDEIEQIPLPGWVERQYENEGMLG